MKCRYNQCRLGGEVEKDDAVKIGSAYYHEECYKEREYKKQIERTYYNIFQNNEPIQAVRRAINKYINKDNYEPEYVLFVLNENIRLNSIFGLIYYLRNKDFESKYYKAKSKMINTDKDIELQEPNDFKYKPKKSKRWGDIICQ